MLSHDPEESLSLFEVRDTPRQRMSTRDPSSPINRAVGRAHRILSRKQDNGEVPSKTLATAWNDPSKEEKLRACIDVLEGHVGVSKRTCAGRDRRTCIHWWSDGAV